MQITKAERIEIFKTTKTNEQNRIANNTRLVARMLRAGYEQASRFTSHLKQTGIAYYDEDKDILIYTGWIENHCWCDHGHAIMHLLPSGSVSVTFTLTPLMVRRAFRMNNFMELQAYVPIAAKMVLPTIHDCTDIVFDGKDLSITYYLD